MESSSTASIISTGFGAAINCMMPLVNVGDENYDGEHAYELTLSGVASDSPGAGAISPMSGRRFAATETIEPFSELYASYGESYFLGRPVYNFVPFDRHYIWADKLIKSFIDNLTSWREEDETQESLIKDESFEGELWDFIVQLRSVWKRTRTMFALPGNSSTTIKELEELLDFGGSAYQGYNDTVKDKAWMEENGQCMDNIRHGISEIPHAGRGAFANRFIPKGGLVAPAPLIHLPNRSSLIIYDHMIEPDGSWARNVDSPSHQQLILNYCFGHRDSSLLLCPYGYLNFYFNHNHKNPNAKVVWADKKRLRHPEWFDMPVSDWGHEFHSGLALEYVALRDIEEGEEVTIDYGIEWESAWQAHVQNFDRPRRGYRPAFELNKIVDLRIPTAFEPIENQFEGVITFCRDYYFPKDSSFTPYQFDSEEDLDQMADWHYTCRVLMRHDDNNYTVEIFHRKRWFGEFDTYERVEDKPEYLLFNVPRDAIFFRDKVYTRDHHQPWAFRHDMRLPDEIFPDIWNDSNNED